MQQITDYTNKHQGRVAFVICPGPSLHFEKLEGLSGHVTFVVNSAMLKMRGADYFVGHDAGICDWDFFYKQLPHFKGTCFLNDREFVGLADHLKPERVCMYQSLPWFDPATKDYNRSGAVAKPDTTQPICATPTSAAAAIHLATIMGCDPIVVVGSDCAYIVEKDYFWQFPGEHKPQRLKGKSCPLTKSMLRGKTYDDRHKSFMDYWEVFRKANPFLNVFNGTQQSLLGTFPKLTLADALVRYKSHRKHL